MVKRFIKQLGLKGHIISCNGRLIRNIETGEVIYSKVMDKTIVKNIIAYCMDNNIDFLVYTANLVYSNKNNPRAIKYKNINKK